MNTFAYRYPVKVYFGVKAAEANLTSEHSKAVELIAVYMKDWLPAADNGL